MRIHACLQADVERKDGLRALEIRVHDTGCGIPASVFKTIFDNFVQIAPGYSKPHEGTGLGLAISRSLAEMMHGSITVESEVDKGSVFTLSITMREILQVSRAEKSTDEKISIIPKRLLIAEDNMINQMYLRQVLNGDGHDTVFVRNGKEVLEELSKQPFDLVISDIRYPDA